jgi:hypothetical protein
MAAAKEAKRRRLASGHRNDIPKMEERKPPMAGRGRNRAPDYPNWHTRWTAYDLSTEAAAAKRETASTKGKRLGELWSRLRGGKDEIASILGESTRRDGGGSKRPAQEVEDRYEVSWRDSICQGWEIKLAKGMGYSVTATRPLTIEEVEAQDGGVCEYCAMPGHTRDEADARVCQQCERYKQRDSYKPCR